MVSDGYYDLVYGGKKGELEGKGEGEEMEVVMTAAQAEKAEIEHEAEEERRMVEAEKKANEAVNANERVMLEESGEGAMAKLAEQLKKRLEEATLKAAAEKAERKKTVEEMRRAQQGVGEGRVVVDARGEAKVVDEPATEAAGEHPAAPAAPPPAAAKAEIQVTIGEFRADGNPDLDIPPELAQKIREGLAKMLSSKDEERAEAATDWMKDAERELREKEKKEKKVFEVKEDEEEGEGVVLEM